MSLIRDGDDWNLFVPRDVPRPNGESFIRYIHIVSCMHDGTLHHVAVRRVLRKVWNNSTVESQKNVLLRLEQLNWVDLWKRMTKV